MFLKGQGPQPDARAKVFWSERAKRGVLLAGNLQTLPTDKQYELWVFDKGKPVAAGVFDVDAEGRVLFESPDLSTIAAAQNFAVTVEPRGGVSAPYGADRPRRNAGGVGRRGTVGRRRGRRKRKRKSAPPHPSPLPPSGGEGVL